MGIIKLLAYIILLLLLLFKNARSQYNLNELDYVYEDDLNIEFYLMKTPYLYSIINCYKNLKDLLNPEEPIKILIHGYQANKSTYRHSLQLLAKGYFCNVFPKNVIFIEYHWKPKVSHRPKYIYIYFNAYAQLIAFRINRLIKLMKRQLPQLTNKKITLVGVGLGAQIASQVGKLQPKEDKLKAIIALDPAVPIFALPPNLLSISKDDANYVEIIHSSSSYGLYPGYGHSDVYINFGDNQPHCNSTFDVYCNHIYAVEVFADALCMRQNYYLDKCIVNDIIIKKCPEASVYDMKYLGDSPLHNKTGIYSLKTKFEPSYRPSIMTRLVREYYRSRYLDDYVSDFTNAINFK